MKRPRQLLSKSRVSGTPARPRLSVAISHRQIVCQLIDDTTHTTLGFVTTVGQKEVEKQPLMAKAAWAGAEIATTAKAKKIDSVVFDRGRRVYHGRVAQVAASAREGGLKF